MSLSASDDMLPGHTTVLFVGLLSTLEKKEKKIETRSLGTMPYCLLAAALELFVGIVSTLKKIEKRKKGNFETRCLGTMHWLPR